MGIPSFYKHLLQTVGGLTSRQRPRGAPQVFALDLNCAIYHCARGPAMPPYTHETRTVWEAALIREVVTYIKALTRRVAPTGCVYVAVDGVAPMAKIRQQRARRFKSAAMATEEAAARGQTQSVERWDTNAITPGTAFMANLAVALHDIKQLAGTHVIVSAADEAGEGEQKIMAWLRGTEWQDVVVYGLDADLIVLALLEHARSGRTVDLFREETEFGGAVKRDAAGDEQYLYLHAEHLATALHTAWSAPNRPKADFLVDFVGAMNLLGNDFVPHGMALKIHDQGIERVLGILRGFQTPLVSADETGKPPTYNWHTLSALLSVLEAGEEAAVLRGAKKKLEARVGATAAKDEVSRALARLNDRPVEWAAERVLVETVAVAGYEKPQWVLRPTWREAYYKHGLLGATAQEAAAAYIQTLSWTLNYYWDSTSVAATWYYPWLLPPLIRDVVAYLGMGEPNIMKTGHQSFRPLQPIEQLAMVLPRTSFHLLPRELQTLPMRFPFAWPERWDYFSLGRRFLWECEPLIPLVQPAQIQRWVDECL